MLSEFPWLSRTMATYIVIVPESLQVLLSCPLLPQANHTKNLQLGGTWSSLHGLDFLKSSSTSLGTIYLQVLRLKNNV